MRHHAGHGAAHPIMDVNSNFGKNRKSELYILLLNLCSLIVSLTFYMPYSSGSRISCRKTVVNVDLFFPVPILESRW